MAQAPPTESASRWHPSLRVTIAVVLAAMVTLTAAVILAVTLQGSRDSSLVVSRSLLTQSSRVAEERIEGFLSAPASTLEILLRDVQSGALDPYATDDLEARFYNTLTVHRSLGMLAFADQDGDFLMVKRMGDGALWTKRIRHRDGQREVWWSERRPGGSRDAIAAHYQDRSDTFDPRGRPWYEGAVRTGGLFWTDVYVFFTDEAPGMTAAVPWVDEGDPQGVLAVDIALDDLSGFLASIDVSEHGGAWLIDARGNLVATPDGEPALVERAEGGHSLKPVGASGHLALASLADHPAFAEALQQRADRTFRVETEQGPWLARLRPARAGTGDQVVAVLAPEADFLGAVRAATRRSVALAVGAGLIAVLLSLLLARRITGSLERLVAESGRVRALRFDDRVDTTTAFREVHHVLSAFEGMKTGLRALQRYVPIRLVRVLLENQEEPRLGADLVEVTVLFSDIEGFTSISEELGPEQTAQRLGDYLGRLSRVIQDHQGTVVHYIGDGIMAFWGAPTPVPEHGARACAAVLECEQVVAGLWSDEADAPSFRTRFGLHTAEVAVGHFGTEERMAYTALGDGVNLASRLEGLGRHYGTTSLISEATRRAVDDRFETRQVDFVRVKGRQGAVGVFELLGERGDVDRALLEARDHYEQGLQHYRARAWAPAIACFERAAALRPGDRAAQVLRDRCEAFRHDPPPEGWRGAHTMTHK